MSPTHDRETHLADIERALSRALRLEAERCAQREPPRLAPACRAPREARAAAGRHPPWRWAAAAAVLALLSLSLLPALRRAPRPEPLDGPASVSPVIDRAALYAALPRIPRPERPPAPLRLAPDLVIRSAN